MINSLEITYSCPFLIRIFFLLGNKLTTETRGDIRIEKKISFRSNVIVSQLTLKKSYMADKGTFSCRTPDLLTANFKVDVKKSIYLGNYGDKSRCIIYYIIFSRILKHFFKTLHVQYNCSHHSIQPIYIEFTRTVLTLNEMYIF